MAGPAERNMRKPFDASGLPAAHGFRLYFCGHCPNGHIVFLDEHDRPMLHATMSAAQARQLARHIQKRDPNFNEISSMER